MSTSRDAFLGGRVQALQPKTGFRSGIDAVLMAAAVPAKPGDHVLELGCGAGVAALCLMARVPGVHLIGVERQAEYAALARHNGLTVVEADLAHLPADLRNRSFDHVMANPPYFDPARRSAAQDPGREAALAEQTPLSDWLSVAAKRLQPKGSVTIIQAAERLPELMRPVPGLGSIRVLPIAPRVGRAAKLVLFQARKGGRAAFQLLPPLILHTGARHEKDAESYTQQVVDILRGGGALPL